MYHAAFGTGQLSSSAIDDDNFGIISKCIQKVKAVYYAKFPLHKDQPCGKYKVIANASASPGGTAVTLVNYFDVECFWYIDIDFGDINNGTVTPGLSWGNIIPEQTGNISGDTAWGLGGPTVRNGGNHPMGIHIKFSSLMGDQLQPKFITKFDACFGHTPLTISCIGSDGTPNAENIPSDAIDAGTWVGFGPMIPVVDSALTSASGVQMRWAPSNGHQVLCANQMGKLDLSIHPGDAVPGEYMGKFFIFGHTVHDNHTPLFPPEDMEHPNNIKPSQDHCWQDQEHHALDAIEDHNP
jgi:hypothetical protein